MAIFQSTHPARGATAHKRDHARRILYFNPRTPRGVRLTLPTARAPQNTISIHAPREGCDQDIHPLLRDMYISIHAPREGCDSKLYQRAESLLGSICLFAQGEEG